MANRPYFSFSGKELQLVFEENTHNSEVLEQLVYELSFRSRPAMVLLRKRVRQTLNGLNSEPSGQQLMDLGVKKTNDAGGGNSVKPSENEHTNSFANLPPNDRRKPEETTWVRPKGTRGLPKKYIPPVRNNFDLDIPSNAGHALRFSMALTALINELRKKKAGMRSFLLEDGKAISFGGFGYGYVFRFMEDANLFEDASVTIQIGKQKCPGSIVSLTAGKLTISVDQNFGDKIDRCILIIDDTALLEALRDKLDNVDSGEISFNKSLADATLSQDNVVIKTKSSSTITFDEGLNEMQRSAVAEALSQNTFYLWGPPGTGKTTTLSELVEKLYDGDKRVLICSNTNKAVDQVLLKICERKPQGLKKALNDGHVVRVGKIADNDLREKHSQWVALDGIVKRLSKDLKEKEEFVSNSIGKAESSLVAVTRLLKIFDELAHLHSSLETADKQAKEAASDIKSTEATLTLLSERRRKLLIEKEVLNAATALKRVFLRSERSIDADLNGTTTRATEQLSKLESLKSAFANAKQTQSRIEAQIKSLNERVGPHDQQTLELRQNELRKQIQALRRELAKIQEELSNLATEIMHNARIIGATVTKSYLSEHSLGRFDVVIIDEASMVLSPALYFMAGMATERVIVSGDFRQLPPIVPTNEKAILDVLGDDVFTVAGIVQSIDSDRRDERVVMLDEQYRMDNEICSLVSDEMYDGKLFTSESATSVGPELPNFLDNTLTIIDTSSLWPFENRNLFQSRYNLMHALLVRNLCTYIKEQGFLDYEYTLGVCTPYTAQAKLITKILKAEGLNEDVDAGTIHRYQGDEKSTMIIDVPESIGAGWNIGIFLQGDTPSDAGSRLFNVAISRAKSNLIVVANLTYLDGKLPSQAVLRGYLHEMQNKGRVIDGQEVLDLRPIADDLRRFGQALPDDLDLGNATFLKQTDFEQFLRFDINRAKSSVVIFSGFFTPSRVASYADLFRLKIADGVKIRCVTRPPGSNGSMDPAQGGRTLNSLEGIGVVVDERTHIHEKVVLIDGETIYFGSLNALSHTSNTDEVMARLVSKEVAAQLYEFLSVRPVRAGDLESIFAERENPICSKCTNRTFLTRGKYGPFFKCGTCGANLSLKTWQRSYTRT